MSDVQIIPARKSKSPKPHGKPPAPPAPPAPVAAQVSPFRRVILLDHYGSGAPSAAELDKICAAMTKGMLRDFFPAYGKGAVFNVGVAADVTATDRVLGLFKDPDQPGALGYHDLSPQGVPYGKVFPLLDAQDGGPLSQTIDHEGKELTEDDTINLARTGADGAFWADESCDAVEQDSYTIDGVPLSNFVYPAWYSGIVDPSLSSQYNGRYDFMGKLSAPLTVDAGGYAQFFDPQHGWQQVTDARVKPRKYRRLDFARALHRLGGRLAPRPHQYLPTPAPVSAPHK
jgi:hypothetical protein